MYTSRQSAFFLKFSLGASRLSLQCRLKSDYFLKYCFNNLFFFCKYRSRRPKLIHRSCFWHERMSPNSKARCRGWFGGWYLVGGLTLHFHWRCSWCLHIHVLGKTSPILKFSPSLQPIRKVNCNETLQRNISSCYYFRGPRCLPHSGHWLVNKWCIGLKQLTAQETTHSTFGQQCHTVSIRL